MKSDSPHPDDGMEQVDRASDKTGRTLVIGCGALAREILDLTRSLGRGERPAPIDLICLPAGWHNRPDRIPGGVESRIEAGKRAGYGRILVAYGDCGTGGLLDAVLERHGVERIGGPHCYSFLAGSDVFDVMMEEEIGSFFLTDYLVRHFDTLILKGMGIEAHPELRDMYFEHYRRLVYLAQTEDMSLQDKAKAAADRLGLEYEYRLTGYGELAGFVATAV